MTSHGSDCCQLFPSPTFKHTERYRDATRKKFQDDKKIYFCPAAAAASAAEPRALRCGGISFEILSIGFALIGIAHQLQQFFSFYSSYWRLHRLFDESWCERNATATAFVVVAVGIDHKLRLLDSAFHIFSNALNNKSKRGQILTFILFFFPLQAAQVVHSFVDQSLLITTTAQQTLRYHVAVV